MEQKDNVIQFPKKPAVFSEEMRRQISQSLEGHTNNPEVVLNEVEKSIAIYAVTAGRELAHRFAKWLGATVTQTVDNAFEDEEKDVR